MKYSRFFIACLIVFNYFSLSPIHASAHISAEDIIHRPDILKKIATKIRSQEGSLNKIESKLRSEHGPNAKSIWQHYDRSMVGPESGKTFKTYEALKFFIQANASTYPQLQGLNTAKLRDLIGKKVSTFYTLNEIDTLGTIITNAIASGTYGPNHGGQSYKEYTFVISYDTHYGEKCTRGDDDKATASSAACVPTNKISIIVKATNFFNKIMDSNNWDSWEHDTSLKGEISTIEGEV